MAKAVESSGDDGSHDRVRALLGEVRDSRAEDAGQPLEALAPLLKSAASRLCLRKEGGIPLLVRLLPTQPAATARLLQLCAERRAQLEVHEAGGTTALLRALRAAVAHRAFAVVAERAFEAGGGQVDAVGSGLSRDLQKGDPGPNPTLKFRDSPFSSLSFLLYLYRFFFFLFLFLFLFSLSTPPSFHLSLFYISTTDKHTGDLTRLTYHYLSS